MKKNEPVSKRPPSRLVREFLDSLWLEKGLSNNTLESYGRDLRAFEAWLDDSMSGRKLEAVRREDLLRYLSDRLSAGITARSTARALSCLRSLYRYLLRENKIKEDPTLHRKPQTRQAATDNANRKRCRTTTGDTGYLDCNWYAGSHHVGAVICNGLESN